MVHLVSWNLASNLIFLTQITTEVCKHETEVYEKLNTCDLSAEWFAFRLEVFASVQQTPSVGSCGNIKMVFLEYVKWLVLSLGWCTNSF